MTNATVKPAAVDEHDMSGQNPFEERISVLYRLWLAAARCGELGYTDTHTHRHTPHHTARRGPHGTASPTAPHHGPGHYTSPVRGRGASTTSRTRYGAPYEVYHLCGGGTVTNTSAGREVRYHDIHHHQCLKPHVR